MSEVIQDTFKRCVRDLLEFTPTVVWLEFSGRDLMQRSASLILERLKCPGVADCLIIQHQCANPLLFPWEELPFIGHVAATRIRRMIVDHDAAITWDGISHTEEEPGDSAHRQCKDVQSAELSSFGAPARQLARQPDRLPGAASVSTSCADSYSLK